MSIATKIFIVAVVSATINGWYTDVAFKEDKDVFLYEELVELHTNSDVGNIVRNSNDGAVTKEHGVRMPAHIAKLSGQGNIKGVVYYKNSCYSAENMKGDPRKRCESTKLSAKSFQAAWKNNVVN